MDNIIFEEETVTEKVFEGDLILDGHMSPEQQNKYIFNQMRAVGIEVENEDEYHIGYDGAEDNNGLSETQYSHYVVTRTYKKKVPYKVTREEIYTGEWVLDGLRITPEQQRKKIFAEMRKAGVEVGNEKELEIGYEGASDNDGISETQTSRYVVYRVKKERLNDNYKFDENLSQDEMIQKIYDELVALRDKVRTSTDPKEISQLSARMAVISDVLDNLVIDSTRDYAPFDKALKEIEDQIKEVQDAITEHMKEYLESYERIKQIVGDQNEALKATMSAEEFDLKIQELLKEKMAENEESLSVRSQIDKEVQELKKLTKKRDRIRKDYEMAQSLGISALEYKEITDNFRSRKLVNAIIEKKGLGDVLAIPAKERTPEQKRIIKAIRKEILDELVKAKRENEDKSVLKLVEALYGLETEVKLKGKQRVLIVKESSLENIKKNAAKMPEKIIVKEEIDNSNKEPLEAPKDMKEVMERRELESKGLVDKFTFFRDPKYPGKTYVRENVFDRFNIDEVGDPVRIDGSLCYEIRPEDAVTILGNTNNDYSPYIVEFVDTEVKYPEEVMPYSERVMPYPEKEDKKEEVVTKEEITSGEEMASEDVKVLEKDYSKDEGEEYIPGTNFKKPRDRGVHETDEEYVAFLKEYYDRIFGEAKVEESFKREEKVNEEVMPYEEKVMPYEEKVKPIERYTIFVDQEEPDNLYARKYAFERFDLEPIGEGVRIAGALCYPISKVDVEAIEANANNDLSPYVVERTEIKLVKNKEKEVIPPEEESLDASEVSEVLVDTITIFKDTEDGKFYTYKPVFERFGITPVGEDQLLEGTPGNEIAEEDVHTLVSNQHTGEKPYEIEFKNITLEKEKVKVLDREKIFEGDWYIDHHMTPEEQRANIFEAMRRAGVDFSEDDELEIGYDGVTDDNGISDTQATHYTVYRTKKAEKKVEDVPPVVVPDTDPIEVDEVLDSEEEKDVPPVVDDPDKTDTMDNRRGLTDQVVIYKDQDGEYYGYKPIFDRFDIEPVGEEVRLNGVLGYGVYPEDVEDILNNQNNDYSPYVVVIRNITLDKTKSTPVPDTNTPPVVDTEPKQVPDTEPTQVDTDPPVVVPPVQDTKPEEVEEITLYRDLNDNYQVYAPDDVLNKFGIKTVAVPTMIEGVPCHKISSDTDQIINSIAKMNKNPKMVIRYVDVHIKEIEEVKPRPHVEEILDKITTDLDIRAKDAKRYKASNLRISKGFKEELHSGNYAYNIVHIVPAVLKAGIGFFRKLAGKLLTGPRAKEAMKTIEERLANLSEEELDVLFEEYKGSQLKTDMNNQINPLILDRLKEYGLSRVAQLNDQIQKDYVVLFTLLGQIKALEEKIKSSGKDSGSLEKQRQALMKEASIHVRSIIENRKKADNLLSSGVHGIEEDFKAVATKLSYVGMRFAKTNDFDNDLQHQLGLLGRRLNTALASGDDEAIVQNFMGLESCYYDNTEIRGSLAGKRSVGSKYYSPVAEQFDYRDDPFVRDLFTTIAVTSAAVSAINAIRVHQIESQQVINNQQAQANTVNAQNQATMNYVHQTGQRIVDKRDTFREGMEAQAQQDILTNADVRERAHLDLTNWNFNNAYHAADNAGHAAYNQFNIDVTNQINAVTADYASGVITQAEALQRMADISSNAQSTLNQVVQSGLDILKPYAASHPQFDLTAVQQSMEYIVAHPNAIADMNQAMVEVTNLGEGLQGLQMMPMVGLSSLPSDMASTIVCAASAALLAANVSNTMKKAQAKKGTYGNDITEMMDDYLSGLEVEEEEVQKQI